MKTTTHEMKLDKISFEKLDQGIKTLELRLMDEKRGQLKLGDHITFRLFPSMEHSCLTVVTGLLHYSDFASLLQDVDMNWLGLDDNKKQWQLNAMQQIYTSDEERENGVLGIRIRKVTK